MILETKRLVIRDVQETDAAPFVRMAADGSLRDTGFDPDCGRWIAAWIAEAKAFARRDRPDAGYLAYTVVRKSDGAVVGAVGCSYYEDLGETGVTYFIGADDRGRGYAAEAVSAYAEHFFSRYPIEKLIATIREENTASWKAAERAGFQLTQTRLYQDVNDEKAEMYRFYQRNR